VGLEAIWSNPITQRVVKSGPMRFAGGILSKAASLPAMLAYEEFFGANPWGDENSPMYGKGPGSLEYQAALENANANGRTRPIEEDYLITAPISGSTFKTSSEPYIDPLSDEFGKRYPAQAITTSQSAVTDSRLNETAKALEKYGFNENFALQPNSDGNYNVVRSEAGQKADALVAENDALLAERDAWLARTANSPAARAGHSDEQRWNLQQKTRDFRNAQKTGTMDEFAQKYPNSNTAKERAIRNRIPSVMDMEF